MIKIKGFHFPNDINIFISTPFSALKWRRLVNKTGFSELLKTLKSTDIGLTADDNTIEKLKNHHRVMSRYLIRVIKDPNPCIITSLALFEICSNRNISASLIVGANKEETLTGHCWVEINGKPINETKETLNKYVRMAVV